MANRWLPSTLVGRTVLVLVAGLVVSNIVGVALYAWDRHRALAERGAEILVERMAAAAVDLDRTPVDQRQDLVRSLGVRGGFAVWPAPPLAEGDTRDWRARAVRRRLAARLDVAPGAIGAAMIAAHSVPPLPAGAMGRGMMDGGHHMPGMMGTGRHWLPGGRWDGHDWLRVDVALSDGSAAAFFAPVPPVGRFWSSGFFPAVLAMTLVVLALSVWAVRRAAAPLKLLAGAADRLGRDVNAPPLDEQGPDEVRAAASAFNDMQRRIRSFVADRTQMLAAISHDLRTPITRLKLRAEFIDDGEQQAKMLADLDEMEAMIGATLAFAREDAAGEPVRPLDFAALVQTVCEGAADTGADVSYEGPDHLALEGRATALKRVVSNLVDNAVRYGCRARVHLEGQDGGVRLAVTDAGPGIPAELHEKVFAPFFRVEGSRSRVTGGTGLGLSVVRSIVHAHGGTVALANRPEGGLAVTVFIPR